MTKIRANRGIELEYDAFGREDAEPLLLVMGLGAQMIQWDEAFCEGLARCGFRVLRFDNRDVGLSTKLAEPAPPSASGREATWAPGTSLDGFAATIAPAADDGSSQPMPGFGASAAVLALVLVAGTAALARRGRP